MIAPLSATALAVILAASSPASSCAADHPSGSPKPTVTLHQSQAQGKQPASSGIEVVPAHCTIVQHRNGDEDWVCEDADPKHPKHYPTPKLRHGDKIVGHGDAG